MIYTATRHNAEHKKIELIRFDLLAGTETVMAEYPPEWICRVFRINEAQFLIAVHAPDGETSFILGDPFIGETEKVYCPVRKCAM